MKKYLFILVLNTASGFASIPTIESLFRNGNNSEIQSNFVSLKLRIQEVYESQESGTEVGKEGPTLFAHLNFFLDQGDKIKFLQLLYNESTMSEKSLRDIFHHGHFLQRIKGRKEIDINRDIFYSVLFSLVLNKEEAIAAFLKKTNKDYLSNKDLINNKKVLLYEKYKAYLRKIKDNPALKKTLESPLRPKNPQERQEIKKLLSSNLYFPSQKVVLTKENSKFFWHIELDNFLANFSNEDHHLTNLTFKNDDQVLRMDCYDYLLLDGIHELPKNIVLKTTGGKIYSLQALELKHSTTNASVFNQLEEGLKKVQIAKQLQEPAKFDFLY